jgi:thiopurine S-methyltransferase
MTPDFWLERWQSGDIGFHRSEVHDFLVKHWPRLTLPERGSVFVPLCGKSLDMVWLAGQGHRVIGSELSPLAVDDFFREQGIEAETRTVGAFVVRSGGPFTIWCGDLFDLPAEAVSDVDAVYDRAALVALPSGLQTRYAKKLTEILPASAPILLVSLHYPQGEISGPPFSTPLSTVAALFGDTHAIRIAETREGLEQSQNLKERGVSSLDESAYVLKRKLS